MTKGADLYRLQCLDSESDEKQRRLAEVEAALGESDALRQARRALEKAEALARKWKLGQRDLELQIAGLADKTARFEQRLYSGAVKNPKELADLQAEVASLRRRRQQLEDDLLETMIEREEAEAGQVRAREHLEQTEALWTTEQADMEVERETLQGELAGLERARSALLPNIEAADLSTYRAVRRAKGGLAVVQLRDGACGGCGVTVSSRLEWELRQNTLTPCSNCGRMIVRT